MDTQGFEEELEKRIKEQSDVAKQGNAIRRMTTKDYIILAIFTAVCLVIVILGAFI